MPKIPTIRSLATQLRLSVATVSMALRDNPRVNAATRQRVQRAAGKAGYKANPLLGAALSAVRQARHQHYRGTLALVGAAEANPAQYVVFHREIAAGAEARAQELGFQTELFLVGEESPALSHVRLASVLHARGIAGAVLLPFNHARDFSDFDFSGIAAAQMDHSLVRPRLHAIMPDHFSSMLGALDDLTHRGYRRIGLCLEARKDARIRNKWTAAFAAHPGGDAGGRGVPALVGPEVTPERVLRWVRRHRPDVIVGHVQAMVRWLSEAGMRVPEDVGFLNLNLAERTEPCAGLDLGPRRLGAAAIETVVAMLHRRERGVPDYPQTIMLEATWVDGPTLRGTNQRGAKGT
jgi:DNA-binding LacI/PurR family transcriptional regulator